MAEDTTYEEAKRCPKCKVPGVLKLTKAGERRGSKIEVFHCETQGCKWYGTGWTVQINADGTIPTRKPGLSEIPGFSPDQEAYARRYLEDLKGQDLRDGRQ